MIFNIKFESGSSSRVVASDGETATPARARTFALSVPGSRLLGAIGSTDSTTVVAVLAAYDRSQNRSIKAP